jgi:SseB protein N-terminal domain/SseB protein C-terminal domain
MDQGTPLTELERLLVAAGKDPAERPAFARAILDSEVYVLGSLDRPTVAGAAQPDTSMRVVTWSDEEGPLTPFFTSEGALQRTLAARPGTDPRFLRVRCRDLFQMLEGQRLVLNPDGPSGKFYLPGEIEALLAGKEHGVTAEVVQAGREVLVGAAAHVPPDLPAVLARFFAQRPVVEGAHLGWITHPDGQQGYLMIVVASDREAALAGLGAVQINEIIGGQTLDVLVVPSGTEEHMLSSVPAFYQRPPQPDERSPRRRRLFGGRS